MKFVLTPPSSQIVSSISPPITNRLHLQSSMVYFQDLHLPDLSTTSTIYDFTEKECYSWDEWRW